MAKVMSYQDEEHESHGANTPSNPRGLNGISNGQTQNQVNGRTNPLNSQQGSGNQDEQITTLKLAGLSVLMYKKKGEIIYRLADNMSVNSLSDEQREMLLKEIKALHDSSTTVITQPSSSVHQHTQPTQLSSTSTPNSNNRPILPHSSNTAFRQQENSSRPPLLPSEQSPVNNRSLVNHETSISNNASQIRTPNYITSGTSNTVPVTSSTVFLGRSQSSSSLSASAYQQSTLAPSVSTPVSSTRLQPSIAPATAPSLARSIAPATIPVSRPSFFTNSTTLSSQQQSQSLMEGTPSQMSDGSSRSTRRYNKTGRYSKKRSQMDEDDSQFTSPYSYYSQPTTMTTPGSYYLNETPMSRPAIPFFSGGMQSTNPITPQSVKRPFHLTEMDRTERTMEEYNHHADIIQRFEAALKADQMAVLQPDYRTPFQSYQDAVARLLPYHIFDYPEEDMKNNDQTSELESTKNALKFYKRRKVIFDKYNDLIKKGAEKTSSTALTNLCDRLINEDCRASNNALKEENRRLVEQFRLISQQQHQQQ